MAKVRGPLFGLEASGTIGQAIVFSKWKGRPYVRRHVFPMNPNSVNQQGVRAEFAGAVLLFKALTAGNKLVWKAVADVISITALNAFVRVAQRNLMALDGIQQLPTKIDATPPGVCTGLAGPVTGNRVSLSWTDPVDADLYAIYVHRAAVDSFVPGPSSLIEVVVAGDEATTDTPGVGTWFYALKAGDVDGNLGAACADIEVTVT